MARHAYELNSLEELKSRLLNKDQVRRLAQALWMHAGEALDPSKMAWADSLLGASGAPLLVKGLADSGALENGTLDGAVLGTFLAALWETNPPSFEGPNLVWTLPVQLGEVGSDYLQAAVRLVSQASNELWVAAPYWEAKGVGQLQAGLLEALHRGVHVRLITQDAINGASLASSAIEHLRRESRGLRGKFEVFSGNDDCPVLLHSKLFVADRSMLLVGSANVTSKGLVANFEAGVVLGPIHAIEALVVLERLLASGLVSQVY